MAPAASPDLSLCVVIHDVAPPTWESCCRVMAAVHEVATVPFTLLAVPDYHHRGSTPEFERRLDELHFCGNELSLHGYSHLDEKSCRGMLDILRRRVYTRGEGEFSALSEAEAMQRLASGKQWFRRHGWPLRGFVAPAWMLSAGARRAVAAAGFEYTSTLRAFHYLSAGTVLKSQSLVYSVSQPWRRRMSVLWNRRVANALTDTQAIARLELHPWDAAYEEIRHSWQDLLARLLRRRQARTTLQALTAWHRSVQAQASGCRQHQTAGE